MQSIPVNHLYEYAVIRYMPDVEREEFINVGLIMMCRRSRWLKCKVAPNHRLIGMYNPPHTPDVIDSQLASFTRVAESCDDAGPIGGLDVDERFRWLTAVRSASFRTSRPHPGQTANLEDTFERLFRSLVASDSCEGVAGR